MTIVVSNSGELKLLDWAVKSAGSSAWTLKLFKNDYTPVVDSTAAGFTTSDFTGYVDKTLTRATWGAPATDANGKASISYAAQSWSPTSSQTCYGYFVVDAADGVLIYAERFATPKALVSGDSLSLVPKLTCASE